MSEKESRVVPYDSMWHPRERHRKKDYENITFFQLLSLIHRPNLFFTKHLRPIAWRSALQLAENHGVDATGAVALLVGSPIIACGRSIRTITCNHHELVVANPFALLRRGPWWTMSFIETVGYGMPWPMFESIWVCRFLGWVSLPYSSCLTEAAEACEAGWLWAQALRLFWRQEGVLLDTKKM